MSMFERWHLALSGTRAISGVPMRKQPKIELMCSKVTQITTYNMPLCEKGNLELLITILVSLAALGIWH
jgi:hypothetical protein